MEKYTGTVTRIAVSQIVDLRAGNLTPDAINKIVARGHVNVGGEYPLITRGDLTPAAIKTLGDGIQSFIDAANNGQKYAASGPAAKAWLAAHKLARKVAGKATGSTQDASAD